jgi:hypothetical protein
MGFSSRLSKVALTLFKAPIDHIDVYIHEPSDQTHNQWIVVAEGFNNDWPFMKGSGMSMSLLNCAQIRIYKKIQGLN